MVEINPAAAAGLPATDSRRRGGPLYGRAAGEELLEDLSRSGL